MQFKKNDKRIKDLKLILSWAIYTYFLFEKDNILICFMNSELREDKVISEAQIC